MNGCFPLMVLVNVNKSGVHCGCVVFVNDILNGSFLYVVLSINKYFTHSETLASFQVKNFKVKNWKNNCGRQPLKRYGLFKQIILPQIF